MIEPPPRPGLMGGLDRFEVFRLLGKGGMGMVLLARDSRSADLVAIKLLNPELIGDARAVHRFLVEARHMQRLDHPAILRIIEVIDRPEGPAFVVPYMEGGCLAGRVGPDRPMDEATALPIAQRIAEALAHAHSKGISHRDLKPANVLLDAAGRAYLADFGLGRTVYNDSIVDVQRERAEGTPAYMSPELAEGKAGDTRCDTYAFGAMLYEMLTGQRPYGGQSTAQTLAAIKAGPPPAIRRIRPEASAGLAKVAEWAMARELRDRYADMADVVADLERIERGQQTLGPRRSIPRLILHWIGRRRWVAAVAAAAVCAVAVWLGGLLAGADKLHHGLVLDRAIPLPGESGLTTLHALGRGGVERVMFVLNGGRLSLLSANGKQLGAFDLSGPDRGSFVMGFVADIDGDRSEEVFIGYSEGEEMLVVAVNQDLKVLRTFRSPGKMFYHEGVRIRAGIRPIRLADLDGDGKRELLALTGAGYGLSPRAVRCFGLDDQSLRWTHEISPEPTNLVLKDVSGDGLLDVVVGSHAVSNGKTAVDGTSDEYAYVHAISHDGKPLWQVQLADRYCAAFPFLADINNQGADELLVRVVGLPEPREGRPGIGRIVRLDSSGRILAEYDAGTPIVSSMSSMAAWKTQILATDRQGWVHVLGPDMKLIRKVQLVVPMHDQVHLELHAAADIDRDGRGQIIFSVMQLARIGVTPSGDAVRSNLRRISHGHQVLLTDADLAKVCWYTVGGYWEDFPGLKAQALDWDQDGRMELVVLAKKALVLRRGR